MPDFGPTAPLSPSSLDDTPGVVLEFVSDSGSFQIPPGQTVRVTVRVASSPVDVLGFQLQLTASDIATGGLQISDWTLDSDWPLAIDSHLDTRADPPDTLVAAASLTGLTVPRNLGTFQLTAPQTSGEYTLTVGGAEGPFATMFVDALGDIPLADDGAVTITANHPPEVVEPIADQTSIENHPLEFAFAETTFQDLDQGDRLAYQARQAGGGDLPAWLVFEAESGTFRGRPPFDENSTDDGLLVTVIATDRAGQMVEDTFEILVRENPTPWQNPRDPMSVEDREVVAALDVLTTINFINLHGAIDLPRPPSPLGPPPYVDVDGDNFIKPLDVLTLINYINAQEAGAGGEGESALPIQSRDDPAKDTPSQNQPRETNLQPKVDRPSALFPSSSSIRVDEAQEKDDVVRAKWCPQPEISSLFFASESFRSSRSPLGPIHPACTTGLCDATGSSDRASSSAAELQKMEAIRAVSCDGLGIESVLEEILSDLAESTGREKTRMGQMAFQDSER